MRTTFGGTSKAKQRLKLAALVLLAIVSLAVAGFALTVQPKNDGSPPTIFQDIKGGISK